MPDKKNPAFQKAKKNRIFQDVVNQIQEAILDRRLKTGDMLPPERELRETFNISRGTLREALRVLEHKGLIEIRVGTGGGSVVKQAGMEQFTETFTLMIRSGNLSVLDISEFREGIEGKIAWLAAERASDKEIHSLEELLKQAGRYNDKGEAGWQDFLRMDREIHKTLAAISNNSLFQYAAQVVHDNITQYYDRFLEYSPERMAENLQDLKDMVSTVRKHLPKEAAQCAYNHVNSFTKRMRQKEAFFAEHHNHDGS